MIKFKVTIIACLILCMQNVFSQNKTITGQVKDTSGNLLPGVSVLIKGTQKGTNTDFDGNYSLDNVSPKDELVFTFIGMNAITILVGNQTKIDVVLQENLESLNEIVVVGYGSKKKSLVTGAISSIDSKQIKSSSNQRVEAVLQGRTSGVTVSSSSGSPGSGAKIRIRGAGSSGNSEPLFIVDGMKASSIADIAPADIANIEILKDAASAAIYGTEGANGVVIITTKRGKKGGLKVSYNSQLGIQTLKTNMELMNASQFVQYMNEAGITSVVDNGYDTNWIDETFSTALMHRNDINLSGATDKFSYYTSASHLDQDGIITGNNDSFKRTTIRINLKADITKWLEFGVNSTYSSSDKSGIPENSDTRGVIQNALILDPLTPVTYANGQVPQFVIDNANNNDVPLLTDNNGNVYGYPSYSTGEVINPVAYANVINKTTVDSYQWLTSTYLKFKPFDGFSFTSRFGYDENQWDTKNTINPYYVTSEAANTAYTGSQNIVESKRWLWENFASYEKEIGNHSFKLLAGYSAENTRVKTIISRSGSTSIANFTGFDFDLPDFNTQINLVDPSPDNMVSMFGRFSYDYAGKYLFEASLRRDKSDKFPTANKAGTFPAFSTGWVVSKEGFWKEDSKLDYLKLRASWGQNGSRSNLSGNSDKTYITSIINGQTIDYLGSTGAQITGYSNLNLVWETSEQLDLGIDLRAFDSRLSFSIDYYKKTTRDAIVSDGSLITPGSAGFVSNEFNAGTIENKGFEFELGYGDTTENGLRYNINANLSTLQNKVTEILFVPEGTSLTGAGAPQNADGITRFTEGQPSWYFYGYQTNGIDPATGEVIIVDTDGVNGITNADKTNIGSPHPDVLFGGNISLGYKDFDFNLQFQGTIGNDIISTYHQPSRAITNKPLHYFTERWQNPGDVATYPGAGSVIGSYQTDLMVEDGSFMRIKQIQFGYTLPEHIVKRIRAKNLRIYVSLDDYFTFTKYKGLDPEVGNFNFNSIGVDRGFFPTAAKAIFGLSLDF
ncbi:SusC/RagA family TonB-linked outer membrane protein [Polaribacter reichenbachii]|uniref:SusC/RagA family TonB-linked outer membrane protein n=2 Tax=Polaribacter reichenbachii TaxID=996801 RepID=A0A1B8U4N5_9FLAO|nr:SusC/RagA family TonB-linked outer membrane protein [Polaribacter reichenbachii]AUC18709.1 SusC/RagA family TonB-linked outer membrane protein [Polaribacter reichenbachii]OBY66823.1 SusC/RagA family TonB-linked outer membrane protein [Polaribacter reichenbachii]